MEYKKLGDLVDFSNGYAFKSSDYIDSSNTVNCRMSNIRPDGTFDIEYNIKYLPDDFANKYKDYILNDGDIIIAMTDMAGDPKILGVPTIVVTKGYSVLMNQRVGKLTLKSNDIVPQYLKYSLISKPARDYFKSFAGGGVQLNIGKKEILNIKLNLHNTTEQEQIVHQLDKIKEIIELRKQQLQQLDELVKARFVELFGDPMINPLGWDKVNISTVLDGKVSNGFFAKRDDYCDDGNVEILGVVNVVNRMYSNINNLPKTHGTKIDIDKYGVKYGDMLFCRSSLVAEGIGKASIVPKGTPNNVLFECHVIRLPLNLDMCVPEFMQVLSTTDYFRNQVIAQSKTATMTTIGQDGILKTDIILPPLELQKQFLLFVEQIDKSKFVVQKALEEAQTLFDSLMQEYFG